MDKSYCPFIEGDCKDCCKLKVSGDCVFIDISTTLHQLVDDNEQKDLDEIYRALSRK